MINITLPLLNSVGLSPLQEGILNMPTPVTLWKWQVFLFKTIENYSDIKVHIITHLMEDDMLATFD